MAAALLETNFTLPGQVGELYRGKAADVYSVAHEIGDLLVVIRTDRISAFDVILPEPIEHKGQVLNQISAAQLGATQVPRWFIEAPDPNVSVGFKAEPFKIEMIVRGFLLGNAWRAYSGGQRDLCGNRLPDGMSEFQQFEDPILTPTTKASKGHDTDITPWQIVTEELATAEEYDEMARLSLELFTEGQGQAIRRGLLLADTKYEFGRLPSGEIVVIDEIHTPDSSRYFPWDDYANFLGGETELRPSQLSKEFVREWLVSQGFMGEPGQQPPHMPPEIQAEVSARYVELYRRMLDKEFVAASEVTEAEMLDRVQGNIVTSLGYLSSYY